MMTACSGVVTAMTALVLSAWWTTGTDGARVLAVFPYNGHSHFTMVEPLLVALSERGHDVTVISPFPRRGRHATRGRYVDVDVSDALPPVISQLNVTRDFGPANPAVKLSSMCLMNHRVCEATFQHPRVRPLMTAGAAFDVVLAEAFSTDCFAAFAHAHDTPLVFVRTSEYSPQLNRLVANPQHPAYLVNHLLTYAGRRMTFVQRLVNTLATHFGAVGYHAFSDGPSTELVRRHFGPDTPPVPDVARLRTALVLVNSHPSLTQSRPTVPNAVEVGGLHIAQTDDGNADAAVEWSDYSDSCDQGVIYVSFGSLLNGASFPTYFIESFVRAFESLPYCVLWKYEGKMESNRIKVSKWMPQQRILGHKNVKVFITHGGLMGVMEAVHFGVPMIGLPIFGDQQSNIANCIEKGVAIGLDYRQITERKLIKSIQMIVTDSKYRLKASELSTKFRDRPMCALDTAVFWTEYVIRHGNMTNTASPAIYLDFYQHYLLDVVGFPLSILLFMFYLGFQIKKCLR